MIRLQRRTFDIAERRDIVYDIQRYAAQQAYNLYATTISVVSAWEPYVRNFKTPPTIGGVPAKPRRASAVLAQRQGAAERPRGRGPFEAPHVSRAMLLATLVVGIVLGALGTHVLYAQPSGIKRTLLMHKELAGIEGREVYMVLNEVPGGVAAGRHFHDGHEVGYVLEGAGVLEVDGEPPLPYKAGDSYHIEATRKHDAKNTGTAPLKVLAVYLIEKGKPLTVPAP